MTLEHELVREKLVASALDLMAKGGLEAVKARTLAREVGVSVGTVYNFFGNVDGVLEHACGRLFDRLNERGRAKLSEFDGRLAERQAADPADREAKAHLRQVLLSLSALYVDFVTENEKSWAALLAFNRMRPVGDAAGWYLAKQAELIGILSDVLKSAPGMENAEHRLTTAWALWSAVHGIVSLSYVGQVRPETRVRTHAQIEALVVLLIEGIYAS